VVAGRIDASQSSPGRSRSGEDFDASTVTLPRASPRMTNMNDPDFAGFTAPVNQVWITAGWQDPRCLFARKPTSFWKFSD
jgi:hypothetical protein